MKNLRLSILLIAVFLFHFCAFAQAGWKMQPVPVSTRWAKQVSPTNTLPEYPRPQMVRKEWQNLNGLWEYAITAKDAAQPTKFAGQILVPYPIESALSGVKKALLPTQQLWYRRTFQRPEIKNGERVLLHFGAVDWRTTVFVNRKRVGVHQGGYQHFSFDITDALKPGQNELVVSVYDPTDQGMNPHGKQTLRPQHIMYTPSSGIWQTVWLETVPAVYIEGVKLTPDVDHGTLHIQANVSGDASDYQIEAVAYDGKTKVGSIQGKAGDELSLSVPNAHLWSPKDPFLYNLSVQLRKNDKVIDSVDSYFGMRKIEIKKDANGFDRIFLNGKFTYNLGVLDQGFWPDGLYRAPTDDALRFDIEAIKAMGFNTIRKHIKVEPERWYYWTDKLGMLVWQDMPQPANDTADARKEFETESAANIAELYNHPSIVTWVLFNEGWGAYDQQRLAQWIKHLDPSRLLNGHTGGYMGTVKDDPKGRWVDADMTDVHDYPGPNTPPALPGKARVLGEYGGIGVMIPDHQWNDVKAWGYIKLTSTQLVDKYAAMAAQLKQFESEGLSGSIYTQPTDVETEQNGLMTYDRAVLKIPLKEIRKINATLVAPSEDENKAEAVLGSLPTPR